MKKLKRSHLFGLMVLVSLALIMGSNVPGVMVLGRVLLLFSTLFHELGHAIMTILVGGHVSQVNIYWDGSGVTQSLFQGGAIRASLILAGGLIGPSFAAAALFWSARGSDQRLRIMTVLLGLSLVVLGIFTARSAWSLVFTLGLGPVLLLASKLWSRQKLEAAVVFIAVQLGISVFTRADYLFAKMAGPTLPSDVAQLQTQLWLPYWFWGIVCGGISLVVLFWGFRCYTKET